MSKINFQTLSEVYGANDEDNDALRTIKEAVEQLSEADKRTIWLYAEEGSMRKVAQHLRVSPATVFHYIHKIRNKINTILNDKPVDNS